MAGRGSRHAEQPGSGARGSWFVVVLVLLLAGAGVAWQAGLLDDLTAPDPATEPEAVPPPPGLELPPPADPGPVVRPVGAGGAGSVAPAAVRRVLAPRLRARKDLGRRGVGAVAGLAGGPVTRVGSSGRITPASLTKLLTTTAALRVLGSGATFTTSAALGPGNRLTLVGGGDPFLARRPARAGSGDYPPRADVRTLARQTARALKQRGVRRVRLRWDDSLFSGPPGSEGWRADYLPDDVVTPIGALWVDEGRPGDGTGRVDDPPRAAARAFATELRGAGLRVAGAPRRGPLPPAAEEVAAVSGAPVAQVVARVLDVSDNEGAEVLAHHVGLATGNGGSFAGGAAGTVATLRELGVPVGGLRLFDGSGLSRRNRVWPATLLAVLRQAARDDRPTLRPVLSGLPVAGFTGSLSSRFDTGDAAGPGAVRAKTGTLTGVHALAGLVTTRDGSTLAFVLNADRVPGPKNLAARVALDEAAAALAACRCGRPPG